MLLHVCSIGTNKQSGNVFPSLDYEEIKKKLIKVEPLEAALIFQALRMVGATLQLVKPSKHVAGRLCCSNKMSFP